MKTAVAMALVASVLAVSSGQSGAAPSELNPVHPMPTKSHSRDNGLPAPAATKPGRTVNNGINYYGGPVIAGTTKTYVIWYGDWTTPTDAGAKQGILTNLLSTIGGTSYYNINTTYKSSTATVSNSTTFAGATSDTGSQGLSNLTDTAIFNIVNKAITGAALPKDPNAVYFVITASNVTKQDFLVKYCGWHTHGSIGGTDVKYSFVGDPTGPSIGNCAWQSTSPNGNPAADAMASVLAHELVEAVTDPDLNAWYDSRGYENADKCAWTFGTTSTATNGSSYNLTLGGKQYLIQRNWVNASGGYCALGY